MPQIGTGVLSDSTKFPISEARCLKISNSAKRYDHSELEGDFVAKHAPAGCFEYREKVAKTLSVHFAKRIRKMLTICCIFVFFRKISFHFCEIPFYREKVAAPKMLRIPFYRNPILSGTYCNVVKELQNQPQSNPIRFHNFHVNF